jgi:LuxR family maltose regulon positive regulatory protein
MEVTVDDSRGHPGTVERAGRRIIERPRLLRALDRPGARVRMLVAPAGYGKTTLAYQWTAREDRRSTWYVVRAAAADVAYLCSGVALAAAEVVPGCERWVLERLAATPTPQDEADVLAAILADALSEWPADSWLVLDDYQHLGVSPSSEAFVAELIRRCPVNVLITSRARPAWIGARDLLYGSVAELGTSTLAMTEDEASEVLGDRDGEVAAGLIALADGWPAVISLAGVVSEPHAPPEGFPAQLYDFFAEEVFEKLSVEERNGLVLLALAPVIDDEIVDAIVGSSAEDVVGAAVAVGILDRRPSGLELHPLARDFLRRRSRERGQDVDSDAVAACLAVYRERRHWDPAFELVTAGGSASDLADLLAEALDDLLSASRLATIEGWVERAEKAGLDTPALAIARAEVALRSGRYTECRVFAERAVREFPPGDSMIFRALMLAGRAAHAASNDRVGLRLFRDAAEVAHTEDEYREARWGEQMCAADLELPEGLSIFEALEAGAPHGMPREVMQYAGRRLGLQMRYGARIDLTSAAQAMEIMGHVTDPMVRSSFLNTYSFALSLAGKYRAALEVAEALSLEIERGRLELASPHRHCAAATARLGLRDFDGVERELRRLEATTDDASDPYVHVNRYAIQVRYLLQTGSIEIACGLDPPIGHAEGVARAMCAEGEASRSLALACSWRLDEAEELAQRALQGTKESAASYLARGALCVVSLRRRESSAPDQVASLFFDAEQVVAADPIVCVYRSSPEFLATAVGLVDSVPSVRRFLALSGDLDAVEAVHSASGGATVSRLSNREREIHALVCEGLTNKQVARTLFISESTVKVHVQHIYDKLGIRSRAALRVQAARERDR